MVRTTEVVLDILSFLSRYEAEQKRRVCLKWSQVVGANTEAWDPLAAIPVLTVFKQFKAPPAQELTEEVSPPLKVQEETEYDVLNRSYRAEEFVRVLATWKQAGETGRLERIHNFSLRATNYVNSCDDYCSHRTPFQTASARHTVKLHEHFTAIDVAKYLHECIASDSYSFYALCEAEFARLFLEDKSCVTAKHVDMEFAGRDFEQIHGYHDSAIRDYCFHENAGASRYLSIFRLKPQPSLLSAIAEKFVAASSTVSFPAVIWLACLGMKTNDLRPRPQPCMPVYFKGKGYKDACYVYVVNNATTEESLSIRISDEFVRLKKVPAKHTLMDIVL